MKINCISCGFNINLDETYDDYEGGIKCFTCQAILEIRIDDGRLKSLKFDKYQERPAA